MSKQRKIIEKFCKEKGVIIEGLKWTPLGKAGEMCGRSGGWELRDAETRHFMGENVEMLLGDIELSLELCL
jgi:hypothetical protein